MPKPTNSKLLLKTFDGSLPSLRVFPQYNRTVVEFDISYYDYDDDGSSIDAKITFTDVLSIDFAVNYFMNCIGAELCGFYEIYDLAKKKEMVEKLFQERKESFLYHGDYDYQADDEHDILNYREPINRLYRTLDEYHLYQQQTEGGVYSILCREYAIKKSEKATD